MPVMLAEDIGGWLVAGALLVGAGGTSLLAFWALLPAWLGRRTLTIVLIIPAILMALLSAGYLAHTYTQRMVHDHDEVMENYVKPWLLMGGAPLALAAIAGGVLWFRGKQTQEKRVEATLGRSSGG